MTVDFILQRLETQKNPSVIKRYEKAGEKQPYIGVLMGTIRSLGKEYRKRPELAIPLWRTAILEAQLLAIEIMSPPHMTLLEIEELLDTSLSLQVLDKLVDRVLSHHSEKVSLKEVLFASDDSVKERLAWRIEIDRVKHKELATDEVSEKLTYIFDHLADSPEVTRWVMNHCLVEIAVNYPEYCDDIIRRSTALGVYRDMIVAKGCTSAYAPDWIAARLRR
ncbi:DNA alkylation repair protein [Streptococcus fryi]